MSVKKHIEEQFAPLYKGFNRIACEIHEDLVSFGQKLENEQKERRARCRPAFVGRIIAFRNWMTHFLLWAILALLLSSCFASGRTIRVVTPKVDVSADTATAYTWPYNTKFQ